MKKINLKGISEILSEKELKNVMGGSGSSCGISYTCSNGTCPTLPYGIPGQCVRGPNYSCICGYVY